MSGSESSVATICLHLSWSRRQDEIVRTWRSIALQGRLQDAGGVLTRPAPSAYRPLPASRLSRHLLPKQHHLHLHQPEIPIRSPRAPVSVNSFASKAFSLSVLVGAVQPLPPPPPSLSASCPTNASRRRGPSCKRTGRRSYSRFSSSATG